jgi:hypothetical protein
LGFFEEVEVFVSLEEKPFLWHYLLYELILFEDNKSEGLDVWYLLIEGMEFLWVGLF